MKIKVFLKLFVPYGIIKYKKGVIRQFIKFFIPYGIFLLWKKKYCPLCEKKAVFKSFGIKPRENALCPNCMSLERHRLLWIYLHEKTNLFNNFNLRILHIAPERCFSDILVKKYKNYLTGDLYKPNVMEKIDITDIKYPDESFDIIICNHVLEHIPDDIKAMSEFFRVLSKGGWAILLVPVFSLEKTYEDFSIDTPEGRLNAFGQSDHVRKYGQDYIDRLRSVGFNVTITKAEDFLSRRKMKKMGIINETMFHCVNPV